MSSFSRGSSKKLLSQSDCHLCFGTGKEIDSLKVREYLAKQDITNRTIAEALDVSEQYVSHLQSGRRPWTHKLWRRMQKLLKTV